MYGSIEVRGARENNLKDVSLDIPKRQLTVFTGVSGSGKSSLVFDTIAAESQRLLNETFSTFVQGFLPHYGRPDVDSLGNLSAAIIVDQKRMGGGSRSTVGTATDAHAMLRMLFSRLGDPHIGPAHVFGFNDPQGMCPTCEGIGQVHSVDLTALIDRDRSLTEGPFLFPGFEAGSFYTDIFLQSSYFDNDKKLRDYTDEEWDRLLNGAETKIKIGKYNITYEGLLNKLNRLYKGKDPDQMQPHVRAAVMRVMTLAPCEACGGTRLNATALSSRIAGRNIADCAAMQVSDLAEFIRGIGDASTKPLVDTLGAVLDHLVHIGLGYLSLDRRSSTLSGGESQRVKMVRHLGSSLTDMTYIFDEPSVGLHAHDIQQFNQLLLRLRDKGNTILVVEHKPDVIAIADHVVDMGPRAGSDGGAVVYQGDLPGLRKAGTLTGRHLDKHQRLKENPRGATGQLRITGAGLHNLRDITVDIPLGVLTTVTGVAGSGKSSLIRGCLPRHHGDVVVIDQDIPRGNRRSNLASYSGILDHIRKAFAKANKVKEALFSPNSTGACPDCKGLGLIYTDLAFLDTVASVCETCEGKRFTADVLAHTLRGKNISDVFDMPVVDAKEYFTEKAIKPMLVGLDAVGLGYLHLGQPLSTFSGGERQRLKLAIEMANPGQVYVLDEPTSGLHMDDVDRLINLMDALVDDGHTLIVIEHNLDVVARADWVIDLGPGAGHDGGTVVFAGTPADLVQCDASVTGEFLRRRLES